MNLREILTLDDNETLDLGRMLWAVGAVVFLSLSIYSTVSQGMHFDPQAFGLGFAGVLAAGGGMVSWMRDKAASGNQQ